MLRIQHARIGKRPCRSEHPARVISAEEVLKQCTKEVDSSAQVLSE